MTSLQETRTADPTIKSIVFSQWTSMLDLLEVALDEVGLGYCRLDGTMNRDDRSAAIEAMRADPEKRVFLVSLKAGGVGLNLTFASRAYIMEPYWNPAVESQAIDRIHRMGQTRPVETTRYIAKDTVEDNIIKLQERKTQLAKMTFREATVEAGDLMTGRERRKRATPQSKEAAREQRLNDLRLLLA
ncbi:P-loop containing nucleoside triphosphate hydrolase protein [Caulochytrium protostelioides]|uniref:P-loop containing nucleoside triphosphate hydrolase protein n=1 Tax=Caulochytrium protostelioides TaxID=1555241 RepID=A0A4P9WY71_9FUNG|nr:P-loop containing nucleoside triphosphate hydrolase protein [Caulochytrium protostelioides]